MRIAVFVNLENVINVSRLKNIISHNLAGVEVFYSESGDQNLATLCCGVQAKYSDYDFVLMLNAPQRGINETTWLYSIRQDYYLLGMILTPKTLWSAVELMTNDNSIGILTLPVDYYQTENWENYENWADYYSLARRWIIQNELHVSINEQKPPIISSTICLIRTKAIEGYADLKVNVFTESFIAYTLSIFCQSNGFLPQYAIPKALLLHNYFGYEAMICLQPEMLKTKQAYYQQLTQYKKERIEYLEQRNEYLEQRNRKLEELTIPSFIGLLTRRTVSKAYSVLKQIWNRSSTADEPNHPDKSRSARTGRNR